MIATKKPKQSRSKWADILVQLAKATLTKSVEITPPKGIRPSKVIGSLVTHLCTTDGHPKGMRYSFRTSDDGKKVVARLVKREKRTYKPGHKPGPKPKAKAVKAKPGKKAASKKAKPTKAKK